MAFKIEIQHNSSTLSFVPRSVGDVGRDILAVKVALGLIKEISNGRVISDNSNNEGYEFSPEIPLDRQNWFDCQTGLGSDLKTACLFDLPLQSAITTFQIENRFLITNYLFEKYSTRKIIQETVGFQSMPSSEYQAIVESEVSLSILSYDEEFGSLGEGTLAVLHGWRPQTIISNDGYVHDRNLFNSSDKIVDIVPEAIWRLATRSTRSNLADRGYILRTNPSNPESRIATRQNDASRLEAYIAQAPSYKDWIRDISGIRFDELIPYRGIDYKVSWENTSMLISPSRIVVNQTEEFGDVALLGPTELRERMNNFFYPDPFSTSKPFIIDENRIGIFYETNFELSSAGPLPTHQDAEVIEIEDLALKEVLDFYNKPKVWNFILDDATFLSTYEINHDEYSPDHNGSFPLEISTERVRSSKLYKAYELQEQLIQNRIKRLEDSLDTDQSGPSHPRSFASREEFEQSISTLITNHKASMDALRSKMQRALAEGVFRKQDFWVLTTQDMLDKMQEGSAQSWRQVSSETTEPLIKFIEYRTPSLRPGHKYRALLEINRHKLDLIVYGDDPEQGTELVTMQQNLAAEARTSNVKVCENSDPEQARRTYEEYKVHAQKKRREFARALREKVQESLDVTTVDMGPMGPFNLNNAFPGLYGLSGITDDYEYTSKALKLLVDTGSPILELDFWGDYGVDTSAESLNAMLNDLNLDEDNASPAEVEANFKKGFGQILMPWEEFKKRIQTASEDLSEAARTIEKEAIKFIRGSNFKPKNEAQLLKRVVSQMEELLNNPKVLDSNDMPIDKILEKHAKERVMIRIGFKTSVTTEDLGPKNGKDITSIALLVQETGFFGDLGQGRPFAELEVSFDAFDQDAKAQHAELQAFESLSRPRTVNYISNVGKMTNPFPSTFKGFVKSFWDDKRMSCSQLGIDSEKGIALSLVGSYTSGIAVDLEKDDEGLTEAFKDWATKNFKDPAMKWVDQSAKNYEDSKKNTFDEEEALNAFGKLCTLEDLYKEFIDKVDLKSLLCDYLKCIGLPAFEFKLPNLYLPPFPKIPILGWYGGLWKFLKNRFKEILIRILCTFVRTLIDKLAFPFCEEQLEEFIAAGSSATPIMNKALADALTNTGITSGNKEKAKDYFDDISQLTTGRELCHLLRGKPLDAAGMQMMRRMVEKNGLSSDLNTDEAIVNYFGVLGTYIPFEICEELENLSASSSDLGSVDPEDCSELASSLRAIRNRLQTGDSNLSNQEVEDVLALAQKNLDDRKAEIDALSGSNLEFALPEEFNAGSKHLINTELPPAMTTTIDQIAKGLFLPAKAIYISCLSSYVPSLKVQTPSVPTAGDEDYDQNSTLTMEACLEQMRRYARSIAEESGEGLSLVETLEESGFFERAKYHGLGNWSSISAGIDVPAELEFLNPSRDLNNPRTRVENQEMIEALVKIDIARTLKLKQIISAFTIFENFGHYPAGAFDHWVRNFYGPLTLRPRNRDELVGPNGEWSFDQWWRVRPGQTGLSNSLADCWHYLTHAARLPWPSDDFRTVFPGVVRNWAVTKSLTSSRWWRGWKRDTEVGPGGGPGNRFFDEDRLQEIYHPSPDEPDSRVDALSTWFNKIDTIEWNSWLELIVPDSNTTEYDLTAAAQHRHANASLWSLVRTNNFKMPMLSNQVYSTSFERSESFLDDAMAFFYGDADSPPSWGDYSGYNFNPRPARTSTFRELKGSPLFLVGGPSGKEFLPDPEFGSRIMTDINQFRNSPNAGPQGQDLFLPLENLTDFQRTFPDKFRNHGWDTAHDLSYPAAENGPHLTDPVANDDVFVKIVPPNSNLGILSATNTLLPDGPNIGNADGEDYQYVDLILGHPFQECRVYSPGEISLNPEDYSGPELINYREGTGPVGLDRIKWTGDYLPRQGPFGNSDAFDSANNSAVQENFFGTIRDYQFIGGPNDAENWEAAPSLGTSLTGRIFFPKSHTQLGPDQWWTRNTNRSERTWYGHGSQVGRATNLAGVISDWPDNPAGDAHPHGRQWAADPAMAGFPDFYFFANEEQRHPVPDLGRHKHHGHTMRELQDDETRLPWERISDDLRFMHNQRNSHYRRMSEQLYMKIVQEASCYSMVVDDMVIPFHDESSLKGFVMDSLKNRIEILEESMVIYGTKAEATFTSVFENLPIESPFSGFGGGSSVSILPQNVKELFTLYETERIYKPGMPKDENPENFHLVHKRYFLDEEQRERYISYGDFIRIMRDPLMSSADRREFYFKPINPVDEAIFDVVAANFNYIAPNGSKNPMPDVVLEEVLGPLIPGFSRVLSNDLFFVDSRAEALRSIARPLLNSTKDITHKLLLDDDRDALVEINLDLELNTAENARTIYENNPMLLEIAGVRMNKLTTIITELLQTLNKGFSHALLPTVSTIFELISRSHPSMGSNLNAVYSLMTNNNRDSTRIAFKVGQGAYSPGISLVDYPSNSGSQDRFNIVVDGDTNLSQGANHSLKNSPFDTNPDYQNPDSLDGESTNFRKIMKFCEVLPERLRREASPAGEESFNKREAFSKLLTQIIRENTLIPRQRQPGEARQAPETDDNFLQNQLIPALKGEIYDEISANIMNMLSDSVSQSPLFNDQYSDDLDSRVSGKAIITQTGTGRCISNRYSLEEASILSFNEAVLGDPSQEVIVEMQKPESSPFNRSMNKLEPFDKAMRTVSVKSFIRICLIEMMLKGGLAYSVWDLESVVGSPVFIEYIKEHVRKELDKNKAIAPIWSDVLQRSTGINNQVRALDIVVREELVKIPQYSQQIFHPNQSRMDYYNWFAYGRTLLSSDVFSYALPELENQRNFFQKEGLFYQFPVPKTVPSSDSPVFGYTHAGSMDVQNRTRAYSSLRSFPKSSERINAAEELAQNSYFKGDSKAPSAKLFFEDYVRVSGELVAFFAHSPVYNRDYEEGQFEWVFTFSEFNYAIEHLNRASTPAKLTSVLQNSTVKIGKRLSLLLNRGLNSDAEFADSAIPEIIRRITGPEVTALSKRERAYQLRAASGTVDYYDDYRAEDPNTGAPAAREDFLVATIPLASHEQVIDPFDCPEVVGIFETGFVPDVSARHNEFLLKISQDFSHDSEFKDYLEHLFPVRRFMAMSSIFATSVLGGYNNLPTLMKSAKSMIAMVGLSASTLPAQRAGILNMDQADFAKHVRDQYPGDPDDPKCFDFPGLGKEFWEAFWEEIKKLVYYFPSILFRGVANQLDPAYKEMRAHYLNCDIRELTWSGLNWSSDGKFDLTNGLRTGTGNNPNGKYVNIMTAAPIDLISASTDLLFYGRWKPLEATVLKTISYVYSGMIPFVDLTTLFKIPCDDVDMNWKDGKKYDFGKYGRYGHPVSPFTALALSTFQLPADKDKRKANCALEPGVLPPEDCDD